MKNFFLLAIPTLLVGTLVSGCIQDDPQAEALRGRLEGTELEITRLKEQLAAGTKPSGGGGEPDRQASRIKELEAEVQRLTTENSQLKVSGSKPSGILAHRELLDNLEAASAPFREQIKSLYQIEQATLRELVIPESPYSCVIRLKLMNLATNRREMVDVSATADAQGQWSFPPIERIAAGIVPFTTGATAAAPPSTPSPSPSSPPAFSARPTASTDRGTPPAPQPEPPRGRASAMPVPGELAGEMVLPLNW